MEESSKINEIIFAVIIPAYNAEKDIENCIKSLLRQTYKAKEIIIVDDGSNDNTLSVLEKISKLDKSIKIIHQNNKGVSAARNVALNNVSSEITHLCFIDSDDIVKPNFLQHFSKHIEVNKLIAQGFIKQYEYKTEEVLYNNTVNLLKQMVEKGDLGHIFDKCFDMNIIRKYKLRFNEKFTFAEDEAFVLDYMQYIPYIKYINVAQYIYMIPNIEKAYTKDNNFEMYFYCLARMARICKILNISLHETYRNRLYRCGKQFFKPSNYKQNKRVEIKKYFNDYVRETHSIPVFFSKWHFLILIIKKLKITNIFIEISSIIFKN